MDELKSLQAELASLDARRQVLRKQIAKHPETIAAKTAKQRAVLVSKISAVAAHASKDNDEQRLKFLAKWQPHVRSLICSPLVEYGDHCGYFYEYAWESGATITNVTVTWYLENFEWSCEVASNGQVVSSIHEEFREDPALEIAFFICDSVCTGAPLF